MLLPALPTLLLAGCAAEPDDVIVDQDSAELSAAVGPNVRVSNDATMAAQDQPTAATVRSRLGHLLVAAHSYPPGATQPIDGEATFWLSNDGGRHFNHSGIVPGLTTAHGGIHQGASDLSLACASTRDCYLASFVYDLALSRTAIAVSHSGDGGATWEAPTMVISEDDPNIFNERCSIAVDDSLGPRRGSVYVSWIRVEGGGDSVPIWFASSTDRGHTFTAPRVISDADENLLNNKPQTVVDSFGRVYVFYENYLLDDPERDRHMVQRSTDGGATFGAAHHVTYVFDAFVPLPPARFRDNSFPTAAAEPFTGALLVAWTDTRLGGTDILLTRSTDGGATWSTPEQVNDTAPGDAIQHAFPQLACGPLGLCGVSFYSSRNDPAGLLMDTYLAPMAFGLIGHDVQVSDVPMNPNVQFNGQFIGDYQALVIGWDAAHPVWTDTRVSLPEPQQDIFTARVTADP